MNDFYGYTCELEHINATDVSDIIDFSGDHVDGRTNTHVQAVIISQTARLQAVPMSIFTTFLNLEQFICTSNDLIRIEFPFCGPRMRIIQLNLNPLGVVQNGAFRGCRTIETLTIILANVERIEENAFDDLPALRDAVIFGNALTTVPGRLFREQHHLEYVRLDQGTITSIQPSTFQCKEFIYELDLRVNRIERIETGTFTNMLRLRTLNLGTNNIGVIEEGAFANLPLLERVELVENRIAVLDSNSFGTTFHNWNYLGVGSNEIHAVDRQVFRRFPNLVSFFGAFNVCFSQNFDDIQSIENDVAPYLDTCFARFDEL